MKKSNILRLSVLLLLGLLLLTLSACDLFDKAPSDSESGSASGTVTGSLTPSSDTEPNIPSDEPTSEPSTDKPDTPDVPTGKTIRIVYKDAEGFDGATSYDSSKGMTLGTPTKTGYDFDGWYRSADFSGSALTVIPAGEEGTGGVLTLFAKWEPLTLTVNLRPEGGASTEREKLAWGESLVLPQAPLTREGYTFNGWKYGDKVYAVGETFTFNDENLSSVTFIGQWTLQTYKVTYIVDGMETTDTMPYGAKLTRTATKTGYTFLGWATAPDATEPTEDLRVGSSDLTVYAVFKINSFTLTVTVEANMDGVTVPELASGTYVHGTSIPLPTSMTGYTLTYKTVGADGTEKTVSGSLTLTEATELVVTATPVKVTIHLAGDCAGLDDLLLDYGSLLIGQLPQKTEDGQFITAWYADEKMTEAISVTLRLKTTEPVTYWAKASEPKTCTFHYEDGTTETIGLRLGAALDKTDTKTGYSFAYWHDADGNRIDAMGAEAIDVYPAFTINSYSIRFDLDRAEKPEDGDHRFDTVSKEYGSTLTLPNGSDLAYEYGTFLGWEYNGEVYPAGAVITVGAQDAVIKIVWKKTAITVHFVDWDGTVIYTVNTYAGDTFCLPHNSLIETVKEFDRWEYLDTMGKTCVFADNGTMFAESTTVTARYCKIWVDEKGERHKEDLIYPSPDSFYFEMTSGYHRDGVVIPTRYKISGHIVADGEMSDAYITVLPTNLCIPSTYNGAIVNGIIAGTASTKGAFCTYVNNQVNAVRFTSIFIPSAIMYIPDYAFYGQYCDVTFGLDSQITSVGYYGLRMTILGAGARNFYNFPENLRTIGNYGFGVSEFKSSAKWAWYRQDGTKITALPESLQFIGKYAFENLALFEEAYLGKNLSKIEVGAFYAMTSLKKVTIAPECPLTVIPTECFLGTGLTEVTIPASVEVIGVSAFKECLDLASVKFAEGSKLKRIEELAFYAYDQALPITELVLPEGLEYIGRAAFTFHGGKYDSMHDPIDGRFPSYGGWHTVSSKKALGPLTKLVLPSTLKEIGISAFAYQSLTEVTLPASLEILCGGAFYYCPNLVSVDLSGLINLKSIGDAAFMRPYDSKELPAFTVTIPENVTVIGDSAFAGMTNLVGIRFKGNKLTEIGEAAFGDTGLKNYKLILPEGLKKLGGQAFFYTELVYVWFPGTLEEIGYQAFAASKTLTEIVFEENPNNENGLVIRRDAFGYCSALKSVTFPCQLIEIQGGITSGQNDYNGAFSYCSALESVTFNGRDDGEVDRDLLIYTCAFYKSTNIKEVHIRRNTLVKLHLQADTRVTETGLSHMLFEGCATLTVYVLPELRTAYQTDRNGWGSIVGRNGRAKLDIEVTD